MTHYDAIVLGTGGVGSAATFHLARRGARVLGLDRFPGGHDRGSSHGQTRIIRQAYFEHADYVPLLVRSYDLWRDLERQTGQELFVQAGLMLSGPATGEVVPGTKRAAVSPASWAAWRRRSGRYGPQLAGWAMATAAGALP